MPGLDLLVPFIVAASVFAFIPGPAIVYVAAQTMARGRRAGLLACLGIHLGGYAHVVAAAFGLSAIFRHVPEIYLAVKIAGALYLIWLGIGIIRMRLDAGDAATAAGSKSARRAFLDSVLVEVLNPKAALFFIAFLPQFVDPSAGFPIALQMLLLGTIVNLMFGFADVVAVFGASALVTGLKRTDLVQRLFRWIGGSLLVGLGVRLAADRT